MRLIFHAGGRGHLRLAVLFLREWWLRAAAEWGRPGRGCGSGSRAGKALWSFHSIRTDPEDGFYRYLPIIE